MRTVADRVEYVQLDGTKTYGHRTKTYMHSPVSIIVPSFNQGDFLAAALDSIFSQDYPHIEVIVIDGGSSDNSLEVIGQFESQIAFWCSESDNGQSDAINKGFERASGGILGWLNSDDVLEPGALRYVVNTLSEGEPDWIVGAGRRISEKGKPGPVRDPGCIGLGTFFQYENCWFSQPSVFWTSNLWELSGGVRNDLHYVMDLDLFYRFFALKRPKTTDRVLSNFRVHSEAKTVKDQFFVDAEYISWIKEQLLKSDSEDVLNVVLERYVALQRSHHSSPKGQILNSLKRYLDRWVYKKM